jgi:hypothetical protein
VEVSSKKQKISSPVAASTSSLLVYEILVVDWSIVDNSILERTKRRDRKLLHKIDVVRKRKTFIRDNPPLKSAFDYMEDFDVEDDDSSCWAECDSIKNDEDKDPDYDMIDRTERVIKEFETMTSQLLKALEGAVSSKVTFHLDYGFRSGLARVLTLDGHMAGGSTDLNDMTGTSAFKYKTGFFDIPPPDV